MYSSGKYRYRKFRYEKPSRPWRRFALTWILLSSDMFCLYSKRFRLVMIRTLYILVLLDACEFQDSQDIIHCVSKTIHLTCRMAVIMKLQLIFIVHCTICTILFTPFLLSLL